MASGNLEAAPQVGRQQLPQGLPGIHSGPPRTLGPDRSHHGGKAAIDLLKEFYEVDAFHEDLYFNLLLKLHESLREKASELSYRVDLDAEYAGSYKAFLNKGHQQDQPLTIWKQIPLPIQRRLAWKGHFLKHFACHPVNQIALECLRHVFRRDSVIDYIELPAINSRLLTEIAKEKRFFREERSRYALVSNPKTPGFIVLQHIGYLRKDNLKKLALCLDANQLARTYAKRHLDRESA